MKIQKGHEDAISAAEKHAVECLREIKDHSNMNATGNAQSTAPWTLSERLAKRRKFGHVTESYINCKFILGSVAEVERLFSMPKYVMAESRRSRNPQLFEAIMYPKFNERFGDARLVSDAVNGARSARFELESWFMSSNRRV